MEIEIIRSKRKTLSLEVRGGRVIARAPFRMREEDIMLFADSKRAWIEKHLATTGGREVEPFSDSELKALAREAEEYLSHTVKSYAEKLGVSYGRITVRAQRTRFGSCSSSGSLSFNCIMMLLSEEVREYLIIHELCHLKEMNHSAAFWAEVEKHCPEYKSLRSRLRSEGKLLIQKLEKRE